MEDVYHYRTMPINVLKGNFYHGFSVVTLEANKSLSKKIVRWDSYSTLLSIYVQFASMTTHDWIS